MSHINQRNSGTPAQWAGRSPMRPVKSIVVDLGGWSSLRYKGDGFYVTPDKHLGIRAVDELDNYIAAREIQWRSYTSNIEQDLRTTRQAVQAAQSQLNTQRDELGRALTAAQAELQKCRNEQSGIQSDRQRLHKEIAKLRNDIAQWKNAAGISDGERNTFTM